MSNHFCHIEFNSNDPVKAKEFFKHVFDWEIEDILWESMVYSVIKTGKDPAGAIFKNPVSQVPSHWLVYVAVDDIDETVSKATKFGAKILKEITEVPSMGKFCVFEDPSGGVLALWQDYGK